MLSKDISSNGKDMVWLKEGSIEVSMLRVLVRRDRREEEGDLKYQIIMSSKKCLPAVHIIL